MSEMKVVTVFGGPLDGQTFPAHIKAEYVTVANRDARQALAQLQSGRFVEVAYDDLMKSTTYPIRSTPAGWRLIWHEGVTE